MPLPPLPLPVPVFPIRLIYFALTAGPSLRRALARGTSRRLPMCKNSGFCTNGKARGRLFQPMRRFWQAGPAATVSHGHRRQPWQQAPAKRPVRPCNTARFTLRYGPFGNAKRPTWQTGPTAVQQNKSRTAWHQPYSPALALHRALSSQAHQSFCSTSISVKVSMMSPCCMSLKLTRLKPHSSPAATSLASSL